MIELVEKDCIAFSKEMNNWKEVIQYAGELLEKKGAINHQYTLDMISLWKRMVPIS